MIVRRGVKVWEGLAHTKSGEAMGIDLSPEEKAGLGEDGEDADVGGHCGQGTGTREQSPKGETVHCILHKHKEG